MPETRQPSQNWGTDIIRNGLRRQNRSISAPLSGHFTRAMTNIAYKVLKTEGAEEACGIIEYTLFHMKPLCFDRRGFYDL